MFHGLLVVLQNNTSNQIIKIALYNLFDTSIDNLP